MARFTLQPLNSLEISMVTRKKTLMPDTDVCGACAFCRVSKETKDRYLCWAMPPMVFVDEDAFNVVREVEVELSEPKCWYYQPRKNS
jgi:hypothetical protein